MYRVRSKYPGNEMGGWRHGCGEVRRNNTGSPERQERHGRLPEGHYVPPQPHTRSPRSQLPSIYGWAAGPKARFSYLVNWEPPLAKLARETTRYATPQGS